MAHARDEVLALLKKRGREKIDVVFTTKYTDLVPTEVLQYVDFLHTSKCVDDASWVFAETLLLKGCVTELLPVRLWDAANKLLSDLRELQSSTNGALDDLIRDKLSNLLLGLTTLGCQTLLRWLQTIDSASLVSSWLVLSYVTLRVAQVAQLLNIQEGVPQPAAFPAFLPGTYDPPRNRCAYYFTPMGYKCREMPLYKMDSTKGKKCVDDEDAADCTKRVPRSATESYVFFIFCPAHGHCWGKCSS